MSLPAAIGSASRWGPFRVHVNQTHLNRRKRILQVTTPLNAGRANHVPSGAPVNVVFGLPCIGAAAAKAEGFKSP